MAPRQSLQFLTNFSASLVTLIALITLIGYFVQLTPALSTFGQVHWPVSFSLMLLGMVLFLQLSKKGLEQWNADWLSKATDVLVVGLGLYWLMQNLQAIDFNFSTLFYERPLHAWSSIVGANILVLAIALLVLAFKRHHPLAVVYGTGMPALLVFNASLFTMASRWLKFPVLYDFGMNLPVNLALLFTSLAVLTGTTTYSGLLAPLASENRRARLMGYAALLAGLSVLIFGVASIIASLEFLTPEVYNANMFRLYAISELGTILVSTLVATLGLRTAFYYATSDIYAQQQSSIAQREALSRRINEAIHSTLDLDGVFEIIVNITGNLIQADRCIICRYDAGRQALMPPTREYRSSNRIASMLAPDPDFDAKNRWLPQLLQQGKKATFFTPDLPCIPPEGQQDLHRLGVQHGIACPVMYNEEIIAVLIAHCTTERRFNLQDLGLMQNVAIQAAIAVHEAELYEEKLSIERQLSQQLEFTRALSESLGEGVLALDPDERVMFLNPAAEKMLGWQKDELIDTPLTERLRSAEIQKLIRHQAWKDTDVCAFEDAFTRKDRSVFPVSCKASPVRIQGQVSGLVIACHDMTEQKRAERALKQYATRLELSNRDLEQFAYLASHDLQAPLIKLQKFTEMLQQLEPENEESRDITNRIQKSAERMQSMILDLLKLARISTSKTPFVPVNLDQVMRHVLDDYQPQIQQLNARVEVGPMLTLEADPLQIQQLLQNLLENALKFRKPDTPPDIKIYTRKSDDQQCQIVVEDNGIGFKPEHQKRIFGIFERLHGISAYEGHGIGLAICQRTAERHHGTITAESTPGEGSRFITTLPCHHPA